MGATPVDELYAVLAPLSVGIAELQSLERHLPRDHAEAAIAVERRGRQLMQRFPVSGQALAVIASNRDNHGLATIAILILRQHKFGAYV